MALSSEGSKTAVRVALLRAFHAENDEPKIFNDYLAAKLITPNERAEFENVVIAALGEIRPEIDVSSLSPVSCTREGLRATTTQELMIARPRFTEDHLLDCVECGLAQYVILGAGLDTFALRRADLQDQLTVFEIDHPATQKFKRARLAAAGLACPPNLHFLPADFERESVFDVLQRSSYRSDRAAFFSWAGVTYYLASETVCEVFRSIRRAAAPGSRVAFDYIDLDAFDPFKASSRIRVVMERVKQFGEPMITGFEPKGLPTMLAGLGFRIVEALGPEEQLKRYFSGRTDGLRAPEHFHLVLAEPALL